MLEKLQNINMPCGFCRASNIANVAGIQKCFKCCRILIYLVDFVEQQILERLQLFKNVANVRNY